MSDRQLIVRCLVLTYSLVFVVHFCNDIIQTFFQDQDFKILSRPTPRPFYERPNEKHFSFSAVNENADENEIPFTAENENGHSFSAEKRKRKSPISIFFLFHTSSHQVSPIQCAANTSSCFAFLQVVLVDGIPLSSYSV